MNPVLIIVLFFTWLFQSAGPILATTAIVIVTGIGAVLVLMLALAIASGFAGKPGSSSNVTKQHAPRAPRLPPDAVPSTSSPHAMTRGLIVAEPWISLILSGEKTWEMRKGRSSVRGWVALIRKGSGQVVGVARLVDSLQPLATAEAYTAAEPRHRIPADRQEQARSDGWTTPWVLAEARALAKPVPYRHPSGAVIWVKLDQEVVASIAAQLGSGAPTVPAIEVRQNAPATVEAPNGPKLPTTPVAPSSSPSTSKITNAAPATATYSQTRTVTVTGGNLRNNHIYLPLEFFPSDAIGGSNREALASRQLRFEFRPGRLVHCDIDGTKHILRDRAATGDFFARTELREGDQVLVTRKGEYDYVVERASN